MAISCSSRLTRRLEMAVSVAAVEDWATILVGAEARTLQAR